MDTRAALQQRHHNGAQDPTLQPGVHYKLMYRQIDMGDEHFSSVTEILHWIETEPIAYHTSTCHDAIAYTGNLAIRPHNQTGPRTNAGWRTQHSFAPTGLDRPHSCNPTAHTIAYQ
jgi:hypothetical protein